MSDSSSHEQTLRSERGFDGKLVHVRVDHVRLPSGRESVREVVEHPGAVAIVALTADDRVIFVRQWRHAVQDLLLEIPAGTRDQGESEVTTARRELIEETGYAAGSIEQLARFYTSAGYSNEQMTLFLATGCTAADRKEDLDEGTEVVLVPRRDVPGLLQPGANQVRDAKSLIGLLWLMRR
jgi:ADP-ribose pyrophosphatase